MGGKKVCSFGRLWNEKYLADIKTKMLIYQSKAIFDVKAFCLVISLIFMTQKLENCLQGAYMGTRIPRSILVRDLLATVLKIQFRKLTVA